MTLIVTLAGRDSIVMAADTHSMLGDEDGHYSAGPHRKIHAFGESRFAIGIAGSRDGEFVLKNLSLEGSDFDRACCALYDIAKGEHKKGRLLSAYEFVLAGFNAKGEPSIKRASFGVNVSPNGTGGFNYQPIMSGLEEVWDRRSALGISRHGALYWIHSFHSQDMLEGQLQTLACFCLMGAIKNDTRVRYPMEICVLKPDREIRFLDPPEVTSLEAECGARFEEIRRILCRE